MKLKPGVRYLPHNTQANNRALRSYNLSQYEEANYETIHNENGWLTGGKNLPAEDHRNFIVLKLPEMICVYCVLGTFFFFWKYKILVESKKITNVLNIISKKLKNIYFMTQKYISGYEFDVQVTVRRDKFL